MHEHWRFSTRTQHPGVAIAAKFLRADAVGRRGARQRRGARSEGRPEPAHPAPAAAVPKAMLPVLSPPFPSAQVTSQPHLHGARDRGHAWKRLHPRDWCRWEPRHLPAVSLKSLVVGERVAAFSLGILNQCLDLVGGWNPVVRVSIRVT